MVGQVPQIRQKLKQRRPFRLGLFKDFIYFICGSFRLGIFKEVIYFVWGAPELGHELCNGDQ